MRNNQVAVAFALVFFLLFPPCLALAGATSPQEPPAQQELAPMGAMVTEFAKSTGFSAISSPPPANGAKGLAAF